MNHLRYTLTFLTPCLMAGANQGQAEIRAASIRGELRWWFRALGGTRDEEATLFGSVHGTQAASKVRVRCRPLSPPTPSWQPPKFTPDQTESYVWYFAKASGAAEKGGAGPRWSPTGAWKEESQFLLELMILDLGTDARALRAKLDDAIDCFLAFGSLGLRSTRGLGAYECAERLLTDQRLEELQSKLQSNDFITKLRPDTFQRLEDILRSIGSLVKGTRKHHRLKHDVQSPLGTSDPRQRSAVRFRPVRVDGTLKLLVLEAPHARVLGQAAQTGSVIKKGLEHAQPAGNGGKWKR